MGYNLANCTDMNIVDDKTLNALHIPKIHYLNSTL